MADAHAALGEQFAEMPQQREAATLGMWTFLATEILFFSAMFMGYITYRHAYPAAFVAGSHHTNLLFGTLNTATSSTKNCVVVWAALVALLGLTFGLAKVNFGVFNNVAALSIAVVQMLLKVMFFMHVRHAGALTWIFVAAGLIWLLIMFDLTLGDYLTRTVPIHQILHNRVGLPH
jgi:caa(3)-type oxidase subunit IV